MSLLRSLSLVNRDKERFVVLEVVARPSGRYALVSISGRLGDPGRRQEKAEDASLQVINGKFDELSRKGQRAGFSVTRTFPGGGDDAPTPSAAIEPTATAPIRLAGGGMVVPALF